MPNRHCASTLVSPNFCMVATMALTYDIWQAFCILFSVHWEISSWISHTIHAIKIIIYSYVFLQPFPIVVNMWSGSKCIIYMINTSLIFIMVLQYLSTCLKYHLSTNLHGVYYILAADCTSMVCIDITTVPKNCSQYWYPQCTFIS